MTDVVTTARFATRNMVNINRQIMLEGMRADFLKVDRSSAKVIDIVTKARKSVPRLPAGQTSPRKSILITAGLKTSGIISPDKWGNLPGGEIFTTPGEVNEHL